MTQPQRLQKVIGHAFIVKPDGEIFPAQKEMVLVVGDLVSVIESKNAWLVFENGEQLDVLDGAFLITTAGAQRLNTSRDLEQIEAFLLYINSAKAGPKAAINITEYVQQGLTTKQAKVFVTNRYATFFEDQLIAKHPPAAKAEQPAEAAALSEAAPEQMQAPTPEQTAEPDILPQESAAHLEPEPYTAQVVEADAPPAALPLLEDIQEQKPAGAVQTETQPEPSAEPYTFAEQETPQELHDEPVAQEANSGAHEQALTTFEEVEAVTEVAAETVIEETAKDIVQEATAQADAQQQKAKDEFVFSFSLPEYPAGVAPAEVTLPASEPSTHLNDVAQYEQSEQAHGEEAQESEFADEIFTPAEQTEHVEQIAIIEQIEPELTEQALEAQIVASSEEVAAKEPLSDDRITYSAKIAELNAAMEISAQELAAAGAQPAIEAMQTVESPMPADASLVTESAALALENTSPAPANEQVPARPHVLFSAALIPRRKFVALSGAKKKPKPQQEEAVKLPETSEISLEMQETGAEPPLTEAALGKALFAKDKFDPNVALYRVAGFSPLQDVLELTFFNIVIKEELTQHVLLCDDEQGVANLLISSSGKGLIDKQVVLEDWSVADLASVLRVANSQHAQDETQLSQLLVNKMVLSSTLVFS